MNSYKNQTELYCGFITITTIFSRKYYIIRLQKNAFKSSMETYLLARHRLSYGLSLITIPLFLQLTFCESVV